VRRLKRRFNAVKMTCEGGPEGSPFFCVICSDPGEIENGEKWAIFEFRVTFRVMFRVTFSKV
jgi:hypothetical protein